MDKDKKHDFHSGSFTGSINIDGIGTVSSIDKDVINFSFITKELVDLYSKKNRDYGNSFDESLNEDGLLVAKIRMNDKIRRFSKLLESKEALVNDESIRDTVIDLAAYAIMTVKWLDDHEE